jgi:hypothetical protein
MDDQLFALFLDKLPFTGNTLLRFYHNSAGEQSTIGDQWRSADEIRSIGEKFVSRCNQTISRKDD